MFIKYRAHKQTNASLISMVQRFSDIFIILISLYLVLILNDFILGPWGLLISLLGLVIFQMIGGITDFYRSWRGVRLSAELILILKNWSVSLILTSGLCSIFFSIDLKWFFYLQWYVLVSVFLVLCRASIRFFIGYIRKFGYNTRSVALAGSMPAGVNLLNSFINEPWLGFVVRGVYDDISDEEITKLNSLYAGNLNDLINEAKAGKLDRIYIAMSMGSEGKIKNLVRELTDTTCSVMLIPDIFTFNILQSRTEEVNGVPVVSLFDTPLNGINMVFKRLEDIIVSTIILILISPVMIAIAFAIKILSPGPVFFKQTRYGMDGKPINVLKFRSMCVMENGSDVIQATKNDIRVTSIGNFLRKTSLDELPQFLNVLSGQMSIVGPRPHAISHNEQYRALIEGYMLRHKVKPGITGLAQINGWRGETDTLFKMEKRVEYDLEYIRQWSIWLDLRIIFITIFKGFINKAAY